MYYEQRKIIYTVLIIIALLGAFFIGKAMGKGSIKNVPVVVPKENKDNIQEANENYNKDIVIKGENYTSDIIVSKATIEDDNILKVRATEVKSSGIVDYKVVAFNEENQALDIKQIKIDDKTFEYSIQFDKSKDKNTTLKIYPLTDSMKKDLNLKIDDVAYGKVVINIDLIKQDMINKLKKLGGDN